MGLPSCKSVVVLTAGHDCIFHVPQEKQQGSFRDREDPSSLSSSGNTPGPDPHLKDGLLAGTTSVRPEPGLRAATVTGVPVSQPLSPGYEPDSAVSLARITPVGPAQEREFLAGWFGAGLPFQAGKRVRYHGSWAELTSMASLTDSHKLHSADHDSQGGCEWISSLYIVVVVQALSRVQLFATPWTAACQASLSFTISWSLLKLILIKSVTLSNHLVFCLPLLLLLSIFPSIRVFSSEPALCIRWPKYWNFGFSISPSNEYSRLISFRSDWFDLLAVQGTVKSSPTPQFESINSSALNLLYGSTLTSIHDYWKKHSFD